MGADDRRRHSSAPAGSAGRKHGRILVEDAGRRRPFMRGIMIHSLMARGVSFEDAYRTASEVRERIAGRSTVPVAEVAKAVREVLGTDPFQEDRRLPLPANIRVSSGGASLPFSKGVLSQSLLAAAIEPNDAFDVAREIERELLQGGVREITRRDLRRRTFEALARQMGEATAERYLVWRRYQNPERPVVLLLGGAAGVGKTSLALEVAHRLGIGRMLSTDSIRQIMRIMLSAELVPAIHASSYDAHRMLRPDPHGDDPVLDGFRAQSGVVSLGVRASIDRAVAENASLVMDGVSIVPGLVDLDAYADSADVIFLIVATLDEDVMRERFESRAQGAQHREAHRYLDNLDAIVRIQDHLLELADRDGVPIVDNQSFDRSVVLIIRHVTETLRKRGGFDAREIL